MNKEKQQFILRERAKAYSQPFIKETNENNNIEVVTFRLGQEYYGIEVEYAEEVYPVNDITTLPSVPNWLTGIMNIRRKIVSIVDLNAFFGLPITEEALRYNALIIGHEKNTFGLLTSKIEGMRSINRSNMQSHLSTHQEKTREFIKGITINQLIILDTKKLLDSEKLIVNISNQT